MIEEIFFIVATTASFIMHKQCRKLALEYISERAIIFEISTIHALLTSLYHMYILYTYQPQLSTVYILSFGYSLGYYLDDFLYVLASINKTGKGYSMILHHLISITCCLAGAYVTTFHPDKFEWYMSWLYLAEISTPVLNYIQFHHGDVHKGIKCLFVLLYFLVRPVNMTYLSYQFGLLMDNRTHPICLVVYVLTGLNYYWFYKIYQKGKETFAPHKKDH